MPSSKPKIAVFDIDHTLLVPFYCLDYDQSRENLKRIDASLTSGPTYLNNYYGINVAETSMLVKHLLANDVAIAFMTHGLYKEEQMKPLLENLWGLGANALKNCLFISGNMYGDQYTHKALKLIELRRIGKIPANAEVVLIDDYDYYKVDVEAAGFKFVHATGCLDWNFTDAYRRPPNDNYFQEIIDILKVNTERAVAISHLFTQMVGPSAADLKLYHLGRSSKPQMVYAKNLKAYLKPSSNSEKKTKCIMC